MPRARRDVMASLERKGFSPSEGDHTYYFYYTFENKKTIVKTKVSHSGKDIGDNLLDRMAHQCKLTNAQFRDLVDCPLSRKQYEAILQQQGVA